jgi:hypothetical protein
MVIIGVGIDRDEVITQRQIYTRRLYHMLSSLYRFAVFVPFVLGCTPFIS